VFFLEGVGNVFQENKAKRDVLVFRGVNVAAHLVGGSPKLGFEVGAGIFLFILLLRVSLWHLEWTESYVACMVTQWEKVRPHNGIVMLICFARVAAGSILDSKCEIGVVACVSI
jgi:hypothetical protein